MQMANRYFIVLQCDCVNRDVWTKVIESALANLTNTSFIVSFMWCWSLFIRVVRKITVLAKLSLTPAQESTMGDVNHCVLTDVKGHTY